VGRVDNVYGDRNLICTCPPVATMLNNQLLALTVQDRGVAIQELPVIPGLRPAVPVVGDTELRPGHRLGTGGGGSAGQDGAGQDTGFQTG
jgi:hypothetical protein